MTQSIKVIGAGLAGSEAAWQVAEQDVDVILYEMRPSRTTPAHTTADFAELVCSNSLGSNFHHRAPGLLKEELRRLGSLLIPCADTCALPAGSALAVDRACFSQCVTQALESHPRITIIREEVTELPEDNLTIVATGPLTSQALTESIESATGSQHLYFYDAIAPIVTSDSINMDIAFRASRWSKGTQEIGDYINCPMDAEQYRAFVDALLAAERIPLRDFEREDPHFFEGCLAVEVLAERGEKALAFGPMRPAGIFDPITDKWPHAVVQLRQDNTAGTLYNLVGFQTNLKYGEQARVFRMIPGLENANFVRYGSMHRNTFINAPHLLYTNLKAKFADNLYFAGQIAGLEGYAGNIAGGWIAGQNAARELKGLAPLILPRTMMIGALMHYITHAEAKHFQPMKANFGLVPSPMVRKRNKRDRADAYAERALDALNSWKRDQGLD